MKRFISLSIFTALLFSIGTCSLMSCGPAPDKRATLDKYIDEAKSLVAEGYKVRDSLRHERDLAVAYNAELQEEIQRWRARK